MCIFIGQVTSFFRIKIYTASEEETLIRKPRMLYSCNYKHFFILLFEINLNWALAHQKWIWRTLYSFVLNIELQWSLKLFNKEKSLKKYYMKTTKIFIAFKTRKHEATRKKYKLVNTF